MTKRPQNIASLLVISLTAVILSFSVKAAAVDAEMSQVTLFVEGMMKSRGGVTWMSWPDSVVAALSELPGIQEQNITVNLDRDAFTVGYDSELASLDDMYEAILELGYSPGIEELGTGETESGSSGSIPEPIASALTEAVDGGKLIFIDFYAEWCIACKVLEENALNNSAVQEALESYIELKVDTDAYADAARHYKVVGMPTLLVVDSAGEEIYRSVGLIEPEELSANLSQLAIK